MYGTEEAMIQNLKDAGCDSETIQEFTAKIKKESKEEGILLLERYRRSLLDVLHTDQRKIDCLDYLVYQLKKEIGGAAAAQK